MKIKALKIQSVKCYGVSLIPFFGRYCIENFENIVFWNSAKKSAALLLMSAEGSVFVVQQLSVSAFTILNSVFKLSRLLNSVDKLKIRFCPI